MPGITCIMAAMGAAFTPITYDLTSGSTPLVIPSGATGYEIWCTGGGGGGGLTATPNYGGGGGGGTAYKSGTILSGEWGTSITRSVGAAGTNETTAAASNAVAGGNSTCSGTLGGVAVSLTGNGGARTNTGTGASGGTATGGDTNATGGLGGSSIIDGIGAGGTPGIDILGYGTGGTVSSGTQPTSGIIRISFT